MDRSGIAYFLPSACQVRHGPRREPESYAIEQEAVKHASWTKDTEAELIELRRFKGINASSMCHVSQIFPASRENGADVARHTELGPLR